MKFYEPDTYTALEAVNEWRKANVEAPHDAGRSFPMNTSNLPQDAGRSVALSSLNIRDSYLRLPQVLSIVPIGRSTLWLWVKEGRFPKPKKLGPAITVWHASQVAAWMDAVGGDES